MSTSLLLLAAAFLLMAVLFNNYVRKQATGERS